MQNGRVMSVGSANVDLVVRASRFPKPGETLPGAEFRTFSGGKGANQAVSVSRLQGLCALVAKLGCDGFGDLVMQSLVENGVGVRNIIRDPNDSTGVALITVNDEGENTIVVAPGTNARLTPAEVVSALADEAFSVLLMQLEVPMETVLAASEFSKGRTLILNPAPARKLPVALLERVDYLTPNESEAQVLTGILPSDADSCGRAGAMLIEFGVKNVLFTLGAKGSYLYNRSGGRHFPSIEVTAVDTTAAGDAFNGAFARFLAAGETPERAIQLANIAGALCATKPGAQDSMPTLAEVSSRVEQ